MAENDAMTIELLSSIEQGKRLTSIDLREAQLSNLDLSGLVADGLRMQGADLQCADLSEAQLDACRLDGSTMRDASCSSTYMRMCVLDGVIATGARFDHARLEDSSAQGANFANAQFSAAKLSETNFARADLTSARLNDAEGHGADFRGACLSKATLTRAKLFDTDFRGADLRDADLSSGSFIDADFRGALLEGACFDGADCSGAEFDTGAEPQLEAAEEHRSNAADNDGPSHAAVAELFEQLRNLNIAPDSDQAQADELVRQLRGGSGTAESSNHLTGIFEMFGEKMGESDEDAAAALAGMMQVVGKLGYDWAPQAINALTNSGDEPPAEIQQLLEKLRRELDLDDATSIAALMSKLAERGRT